jgi:hypothetical protein
VLYEEHDALVALNAKAEKALLAEARKHREWDWVRTPTGAWIKTAVQRTRGLNRNFNHRLKGVFKGAATTVIGRADDEPLYHHYERLLDGGTKPNLAKLTLARQIAAIALAVWRSGEAYDPTRLEANGVERARIGQRGIEPAACEDGPDEGEANRLQGRASIGFLGRATGSESPRIVPTDRLCAPGEPNEAMGQ